MTKSGSPAISRILSEGVIFSAANLLSRLVFFGMTIVLSRIFMPEEYGHYVLVKTAILCAAVLDVWLLESVMRFHAEHKRKGTAALFQSQVQTIAAWHVTIIMMAMAATLILLSPDASLRQLLLTATVIYILDYLYRLHLQLLRAMRDVRAHSVLSFAYAALRFGIALALIFGWSRSIHSVLLAWIAADVVLLPFLIQRTRKRARTATNPAMRDRIVPQQLLGQLVRYGLPFLPMAAGWTGLYLADRFMLQYLQEASQLGLYGLASSFAELGYIIPYMLIATPAQAAIIEAWSDGREEGASECLSRLVRLHLLIALPLIAALATLATPIVMTVAHEAYLPAAGALSLLAPGVLGWGLLSFTNLSFMLKKRTDLLAALGLAGLTVNIILNWLLISRYGFLGAAAATSLTYTALAAAAWFMAGAYLRLVPRIPWLSVRRSLLATAFMVAVTQLAVRLLPVSLLSLILVVGVGALAYCFSLIALGEYQINDGARLIRRLLPRQEQTT